MESLAQERQNPRVHRHCSWGKVILKSSRASEGLAHVGLKSARFFKASVTEVVGLWTNSINIIWELDNFWAPIRLTESGILF